MLHRSVFREALTWFEIHGSNQGIVDYWTARLTAGPQPHDQAADGERPFRRRRRRRRRHFAPTQGH